MSEINLAFYDTLADTMASLRVLVKIAESLKEDGSIVKDSKIDIRLRAALRELESIYFS